MLYILRIEKFFCVLLKLICESNLFYFHSTVLSDISILFLILIKLLFKPLILEKKLSFKILWNEACEKRKLLLIEYVKYIVNLLNDFRNLIKFKFYYY